MTLPRSGHRAVPIAQQHEDATQNEARNRAEVERVTRVYDSAFCQVETRLSLLERGVSSFTYTVTENAGDGTTSGDANATDYTGQTGAVAGAADAPEGSLVFVAHKGILYTYTGPKPVHFGAGPGSTYTTTAADFEAIGSAVDWDDITNKPTQFPPEPHTHVEADITDLDKYDRAAVDAKDAAIQGSLDAHKADTNNPHGTSWDTLVGVPEQPDLRYPRWQALWVSGQYPPLTMTRDGFWTMISNTTTEERPAPQPVGDPFYVSDFNGTPAFQTETITEGAYITGNEYTWDEGGYADRIRVYIPDGSGAFTFEVWVWDGPVPMNNLMQVAGPVPGTKVGWFEFPIGTRIFLPGQTVSVAIVGRAVARPTTFTEMWSVKNKNGNPSENEANFQNSATQLRVHNIDKNGDSQRDNLVAVPGDGSATLQFAGQTWTIIGVNTNNATRVNYDLSPNQGRPKEDDRNLAFSWGAVDPIPYVTDPAYYAGFTAVRGFAGAALDALTYDDSLYGADVRLQKASVSPDWDLVAYSPA